MLDCVFAIWDFYLGIVVGGIIVGFLVSHYFKKKLREVSQ